MDKQLHNDLCGRIPYLPIVEWRGEKWMLLGMVDTRPILAGMNNHAGERHIVRYDEEFKPYLRPMDSMTEQERKEWSELTYTGGLATDQYVAQQVIDWLHAHHFDYHDLIDNGLAIKAPEGMYDI